MTKDQAVAAGQIASQIDELQSAIAELQATIADSSPLLAISARTVNGKTISSTVPLSGKDSLIMLNGLLAIYQNMSMALVDQLGAM